MKLFAGRNLNIKKILVLLGYSFYREFMEGDFFFSFNMVGKANWVWF
jgi:hypothetical protein